METGVTRQLLSLGHSELSPPPTGCSIKRTLRGSRLWLAGRRFRIPGSWRGTERALATRVAPCALRGLIHFDRCLHTSDMGNSEEASSSSAAAAAAAPSNLSPLVHRRPTAAAAKVTSHEARLRQGKVTGSF